MATYYSDTWLGTPVATQIDSTINFDWGDGGSPVPGVGPTNWSARWDGLIQAQETGTYTFYTTTDGGCRLWVNNQLLIDNWGPQASATNSGTIDLVAGQQYSIRMEYCQFGGSRFGEAGMVRPQSDRAKWFRPAAHAPEPSPGQLSARCGEHQSRIRRWSSRPPTAMPSASATWMRSPISFRSRSPSTNGTLTLGSVGGLEFTAGDGTSDATMTFTGTLDDINAALDGLTFNPTANYNGGASLRIVTTDLGTGKTADSSLPITVIAVNHAPTIGRSQLRRPSMTIRR